MAKVPFFVHLAPNPSEMTQVADNVLPSTFNSAERWFACGEVCWP